MKQELINLVIKQYLVLLNLCFLLLNLDLLQQNLLTILWVQTYKWVFFPMRFKNSLN